MAFFEGNNMTGGYGKGPDIINSCSVNVERGEIVSILGPNGAGKSTAMKAMLGLLNLKSGSIIIDGKDISNLSPQDRVKEGISFVPQTKNVFAGMTVEENLEMGAFLIDPVFKFNKPNIAFIAVDFPAPLGPRIETISPFSTLTVHELIMSGPFPYPPVILLPSKNAILIIL